MGRHQGDVTMELHLNDILELKKDHPCGRGDAAAPQGGEDDQAHRTEGGMNMRPKWTRYVAMGIALLLAFVMLVSLVVPYLGM